MGIPQYVVIPYNTFVQSKFLCHRLFNVIKDYEESTPIAQLAEEHHRRRGRPLRIAVDEADWRFNNVTQAQVYAIRESMNLAALQVF